MKSFEVVALTKSTVAVLLVREDGHRLRCGFVRDQITCKYALPSNVYTKY